MTVEEKAIIFLFAAVYWSIGYWSMADSCKIKVFLRKKRQALWQFFFSKKSKCE